MVTGLDALIDIKGPLLLKEDCCECSKCNGEFPPDEDKPPFKLSQHEAEGDAAGTDAATGIVTADIAVHPMLLNIPDPATGANMVHYVIDQDARAEVGLFNETGERVRVIDEGMRAYGQHAVQLDTDGLPAGSYSLQLVYAEHTLSVPVDVE